MECGLEHPDIQKRIEAARGHSVQFRTTVLRDKVFVEEVPDHGQ